MQKGDNNNSDSSVKVFIRVRPLISIQENSRNIVSIGADEQSVVIFIDEYNQIETKFDKIVSSLKNQKQMFMNVRPFIQKILDGYNFTIFAYGQTGSGKTYTMFGKDWQNNFAELEKSKKSIKQNTPLTDVTSDDNFAGIIPRSTYHIFSCLLGNPGGYNVYCSFLQIYNQKLYDLLQDTPIPNPLNIHESKFEGIFVQGLGEFKVEQYTDCLELIRRGQKNRFIRQTSMNAKSSRSHTIFQIIIQSTRPNAHGEYTRARMNLCDLAGSEKINKMEHMKKEHLDQLKNINLSLTTLGKVINALSKGLNKNLAFFRQSKLTRLLQESLVGNTNTIIVGAISPSSKNKQQTLNTLKFVERAKHIKLKIKPSSISNQSGDLVNRLQEQMEQLRRILMEKEKNKVPKQIEQKLYQLQQQNHTLKNQTSNKNENIYALIEQNRKMKQALNRMQKVAIEQLSNASFLLSEADSHKMSYRLSHKQKMKQTDRFDELQSSFKFNTIPRYQDQGTPPRKQFLPPISSRLNKSLNVIPESDISRPAMVIDDRGRKNIINKFQQIQLAKKRKQNKLINELDPILINQQQKSSQIRSQSTNSKHPIATHSTIQQDSLRGKSKKKPNFADKIKQLEARLKNSKK